MKHSIRFLATVGSTVLLLVAFAAPGAAQQCVPFQGIDHCSLGPTSLALTPDGLNLVKVGGAGVVGGVASHLPAGTTFWAAQLAFEPGIGPGPWMLMSAIADGAAVARLRLDEIDNGYLQGGPAINNGYLVSLGFTGAAASSTYSVLVFNDGVLQGAVGGVSSDPQVMQTTMPHDDVPDPWDVIIFDWPGPWIPDDGPFPGPGDDPFPEDDGPTTTFGIEAISGACFYSMSNGLDMLVHLPGGQLVTGDEIRFVEEVAGAGHGGYQTFHGMETTIGAQTMTIVNEISNGI
ncbi:MAG: hypothetical protein AAGC60_23115 [Acidobacteriota bacterium]